MVVECERFDLRSQKRPVELECSPLEDIVRTFTFTKDHLDILGCFPARISDTKGKSFVETLHRIYILTLA
jgi:hypothetical protein